MEKVSIVIPTFNQVRYLPTCIDNCLFQTYPNLEIIIVDGGSTDGTKAFLNELMGQISTKTCNPVVKMTDDGAIVRKQIQVYPQNREIQIVSFQEDIGPTRTYNEGLARVCGKYCTYIVGDDIPHPHMIEELVLILESTGVDFVYSDINLVDDQGRIIRQMKIPDYKFESCLARWFHLGVSRLYKTEWHYKVGLMDESFVSANDYDHYLRFAMAGAKFYHLPRILYSVRYHGEDRKTGQHTEDRYNRLIKESKLCAKRAREWLSVQNRS